MRYKEFLRKAFFIPVIFIFLASSCGKDKTPSQPSQPNPPNLPPPASDADLTSLPKDAGGTQTSVLLNNTDNTLYGYYVYTPSGYQGNQASYPLLIFLHGSGDIGNSMTTPTDLKRILNSGPPSMISKKTWSPRYPMIVVSPQCTQTANHFAPDVLNEFIKSIIAKYRINTHRIYLTGLSLGGGGTWNYLITYSNKGYIAAAAPIAAGGAFKTNLVDIPIWTFCGEADANNFPKVKATIAELNQYSTTLKAKLTAFPGIGHNCWDITYSGSGMGTEDKSYDAFNKSIYDWMFQYSK